MYHAAHSAKRIPDRADPAWILRSPYGQGQMKKAGEESEMKMLADAGMMLGKGHEILLVLTAQRALATSPANGLPRSGPSGLPFSSCLSSLSVRD